MAEERGVGHVAEDRGATKQASKGHKNRVEREEDGTCVHARRGGQGGPEVGRHSKYIPTTTPGRREHNSAKEVW